MLFNSFEYFLFLPAVLLAYWSIRGRFATQNTLLLIASYFFYGWWDVRFLFLIALTTCIDFNAALLVESGKTSIAQRLRSSLFLVAGAILFLCIGADFSSTIPEFVWAGISVTAAVCLLIFVAPVLVGRLTADGRRRAIIVFSVVANLSILGFFKYFNFFADSFSELYAGIFGSAPSFVMLNIVLPVGISFYTFQSLSYTIDVYRRDLKPTNSLIEYAAYLSFFPQLVAGPIERGKSLLPQFQRERVVDSHAIKEGLWLIVWGLYKKIVIADNVAIIVNAVFSPYDAGASGELPAGGGLLSLIAIYAFAFQIYADFSAYSDIARGTAKLMGFDLMLNFRIPYVSANPSEFWQRWHISLSSWLRDYLYIPLGGNRGGKWKTYRNLWLTMLLGGLWHGASWTFVLWGFYQGLILVIYRLLGKEDAGSAESSPMVRVLNVIWFFQLTCLGWLIFRAQNLDSISLMLQSIFLDFRVSDVALKAAGALLFYIVPLILVQAVQLRSQNMYILSRFGWVTGLHIWFFVVMSMVAFHTGFQSEFIYFAF